MDVMEALKAKGYTSYKLRHDKIFGEGTMTRFRNKRYVSIQAINVLCGLLDCRIEDIIEHVRDNELDNELE